MDLSRLYPAISFPVSRGTPMISPLIKWNHKKDWYVPFQTGNLTSPNVQSGKLIVVSYENEDYRFLQDCIIDERNVFPESGILVSNSLTYFKSSLHSLHIYIVMFTIENCLGNLG